MGEWREANRANWDERVPTHVSGEFYDVASARSACNLSNGSGLLWPGRRDGPRA